MQPNHALQQFLGMGSLDTSRSRLLTCSCGMPRARWGLAPYAANVELIEPQLTRQLPGSQPAAASSTVMRRITCRGTFMRASFNVLNGFQTECPCWVYGRNKDGTVLDAIASKDVRSGASWQLLAPTQSEFPSNRGSKPPFSPVCAIGRPAMKACRCARR